MSFKILGREDLEVEKIKLSTKNPRKHFRSAGMEELKDSIKNIGLIQPILVKKLENNHYEAIAGNRRLFAFKELKKKNIPSIIVEADSEITENDIALIENLVRDDLSPIEEAKAYMNRWELMGHQNRLRLNESEIAGVLSKELPKPKSTIYRKISLLKLPETIQDAIHLGKLEQGKGYELSRLSSQDQMMDFFKRITNPAHENGWTIAKIKEAVNSILEKEQEKIQQKKKIKAKILDNTKENLNDQRKTRDSLLEKFTDLSKKIESLLKEDFEIEEDLDTPNTILKTTTATIKREEKAVEKGWKKKQKQIENIQKRINSIDALFNQVEELHISVCPYCGAGIDIDTLEEEQQKLREKIEDLEEEQINMNQNLKKLQKHKSNFSNLKNLIKKNNAEIKGYIHDIAQSRRELKQLE